MRPWSWDDADGRAHLKLYKPFGGEADHLVQKFGIRGLLHERAQVIMSLVIGGPADKWLASTIKPYWKPPVTAQRSATPRYGTQSFNRSSKVLIHNALAIPSSGTHLNNGGSSQPSAAVLFLRCDSLLPYEVIFGLPSFENYCLQSSSALNAEENQDASPGRYTGQTHYSEAAIA